MQLATAIEKEKRLTCLCHAAMKRISPAPSPYHQANPSFVDNSQHIYIPVKLKCGVSARCRPNVLSACPQVLVELNNDLTQCLDLLPRSIHSLIRKTVMWVNLSYTVGMGEVLTHSTTHHHESWLLWTRDKPEKVNGIEIYNCNEYLTMRLHWNGCGLILHELCHVVHQHCLVNGLENHRVKEAYLRAEETGLYEQVLRRDCAGKTCDADAAYASLNEREFFAELSVAYWASGYSEYDEAKHSKMTEASPPIIEPGVVERVQATDSFDEYHQFPQNELSVLPHCNKFYPFTQGQLRHYDRETYHVLERIWSDIASGSEKEGWRVRKRCCCWFLSPIPTAHDQNVIEVSPGDTVML